MRLRLLLLALLAWQLYEIEAALLHAQPMPRASTATDQVVHIVYMGAVSDVTTTNTEDFHKSILQQALGSAESASSSHLYSYTKSFNGFAATFSDNDAETIRGIAGVVSVFKSEILQLHTTDSWQYLGLNPTQGVWVQSDFGNGTIVGLVDSGIWPEADSFKDDGFGPIPSKWNGSCESGDNFTAALCNNKLIGAKFFAKGIEAQGSPIAGERSPRDYHGHGTHTSSTATGRRVPNASVNGIAGGTASGGAPSARIAMYKACWPGGYCTAVDVLAAMDEAIADGVDVLSLSLGFGAGLDYITDPIAIGAFHAIVKGIFVSCSAGNSGSLGYGNVANAAPWIFTIAASTQNRVLDPVITISSGEGQLVVQGINTLNAVATNESYPMIYIDNILISNISAARGKIIVTQSNLIGLDSVAQRVNATGLICVTSTDESVQLKIPVLPYANVDSQTGTDIVYLINTTTNFTASISKAYSVYNSTQAPIIAWFSSIGPSAITPQILKPDISAPGVDILAAWVPLASTSTGQVAHFNIISGTSMSCPHAAGTAALVKSLHPDWSPAAIKSAIMTTATPFLPLNRSSLFGNDSIAGNSPIATGAGQINPTLAADPGLVFNITTADYVNFLCGMGYNASSIRLMTGDNETCTRSNFTALELNYPSIYLDTNFTVGVPQIITRTVTNVGPGPVTYHLNNVAKPSPYLNISVDPTVLQFTNTNEEQSFNLSVTVTSPISDYTFGSISWSDLAGHVVTVLIGAGVPVTSGPF